MQKICGFLAVVLTLLALSILCPHNAYAAYTAVDAGITEDEMSMLTWDCDKKDPVTQKTFNETVANNRAKAQQDKLKEALNVSFAYPITSAANACVDRLMQALMMLPRLSDPLGIAVSMVMGAVTNLITQQCSQILGFVSSVQNTISQYTHICLPMPSFDPYKIAPISGRSDCDDGSIPIDYMTSFRRPTKAEFDYKKFQAESGRPRGR